MEMKQSQQQILEENMVVQEKNKQLKSDLNRKEMVIKEYRDKIDSLSAKMKDIQRNESDTERIKEQMKKYKAECESKNEALKMLKNKIQ